MISVNGVDPATGFLEVGIQLDEQAVGSSVLIHWLVILTELPATRFVNLREDPTSLEPRLPILEESTPAGAEYAAQGVAVGELCVTVRDLLVPPSWYLCVLTTDDPGAASTVIVHYSIMPNPGAGT